MTTPDHHPWWVCGPGGETYEAVTGKSATWFSDGDNEDMAIMYELGVIDGYNKADEQSIVTMLYVFETAE